MSRKHWGRGAVYQRGGRFWIRYPDGTGKQRREGAGTDGEKAQRLLDRRLVEVEDGKIPIKPKERKRTVNDLLDELVKEYAVQQRRSTRNLPSAIKHLRRELGDLRAGSVTTADLRDFVQMRQQDAAANATIVREMRHLATAFRLQSAVPIPKFPNLPRGKVRDVLIAPAEQRGLLAAISNECYRDVTAFAFAAGWRGKEVRTLQWKHVLRASGIIRLAEEHSKTAEPRDFPLVGAVASLIDKWEAKRLPYCAAVFHRNGSSVKYGSWLGAFNKAAVQVGLAGVRPHDTRRAFVTDMNNAGQDSQTVMALSGHRTRVIYDRYRILQDRQPGAGNRRHEQYLEQR